MKVNQKKTWWLGGLLLVCLLAVGRMLPAQAAQNISVTSCKISDSKEEVVVQAKASGNASGSDGKYYLFALEPYESGIKSNAEPLSQCDAKSGSFSMSCPLNAGTKNSRLYSRFVVAVKQGGGYQIASDASYITNPEKIAKYTYAFPEAKSKKGLQTDDFMSTSQLKKDVKDLGVKHAVMTISLDDFVLPKSQWGSASSIAYTYQGKEYYFNLGACAGRDQKVRTLTDQGAVITFVLVLRGTDPAKSLVTPAARGQKGAAMVGLNTSEKEGMEYLAALISFLGERYMAESKANGQVVNWIVGNEVDYYGMYNYMGDLSLNNYVKAYADSYRVVSTALRSVYSQARVYISLTHCWNVKQPDGRSFTSKQVLDGFAKAIKEEGKIPWNLAYHAYPQPLTDAKFWDDMTTNSVKTQYITMDNLDVLTDYVTSKYGKNVHIILSEQGFTSSSGEKVQAAAIAYAYFIAEANPRIDAFVVQRHQDHAEETNQGLYLGLKSANGKKKMAWNIFKYMDTAKSEAKTKKLASVVGVKSFEKAIPGFRYSKLGKGTSSGASNKGGTKKVKLNSGWKKAGSRSVKSSGKNITVQMKQGKALQGISKKLEKKTSFAKKSKLQFQVTVSKIAKSKYADVRVQFYSKNKKYEKKVKVRAGKKSKVSVSAKGWKYADSVTRIRIMVKPAGKGRFQSGGKLKISNIKQA